MENQSFKILVLGGHEEDARGWVTSTLDAIHLMFSVSDLIEFSSPGVERQARDWATSRSIPVWTEVDDASPSDSHLPIMLMRTLEKYEPNLVVVFGVDERTQQLETLAKARGILVIDGNASADERYSTLTEAKDRRNMRTCAR